MKKLSCWSILSSAFFKFDPESVHNFVLGCLKLSGAFPFQLPLKLFVHNLPHTAKPVSVLGMDFESRVGLAAGFDKDCDIIEALPALGFGFVEIGTVTPLPQSGNEKPRLFRRAEQNALFNRMGFNNQGAKKVADKLKRAKEKLPERFRVGVNIGKNKWTELENAPLDYAKAAAEFENLADFIVVNVSSPNTPGLRSLQTAESLNRIVGSVCEVTAKWTKAPPVLLKLAPEVCGEELKSIIVSVEEKNNKEIAGWIFTNTLAGTWNDQKRTLSGGWSGGPLTEISKKVLTEAKQITSKPLVSVGGILTEDEARERITLGAELIEIYTGWIYNGPGFPARVARSIAMA